MAPLQVIILIMVVLFYVTDDHRAAALPAAPWLIVALVLASHIFLIAIVGQTARRIARKLHHPDVDTTALATRMDRVINIARWTTIALAAAQLWLGGWGALVLAPHEAAPSVGGLAASTSPAIAGGWGLIAYKRFLLPQFVLLLPPIVSWLCFWAAFYNVEIALRQRAMPYRLATGLPTHEAPSRFEFVLLQARHNFYFFIPMAIATLVEGWAETLKPAGIDGAESGWGGWITGGKIVFAASLAVFILTFAFLPWIITRLWLTVPMTGSLRTRLENLAARYHLRFSNILIWRTHFSFPNAAILGYLPFSRYFLMTDSLLESLTDRQIEAVFAHEVGHGCHRHIWWYALSIGGCVLVAIGLSAYAGHAIELYHPAWKDHKSDVENLVQLAILAAFMIWGFAPISRRFEHQADWFAAQHMAASLAENPLDNLPASPADPAPSTSPPPPNFLELGAEAFSQSLLQLVGLSHRPRNKRGWMHPSPIQRAQLLRALATDPARVAKFGRQMFFTRLSIVLLLAAGSVLAFSAKISHLI